MAKLSKLDEDALAGKLPPIEWHINNIVHFGNKLSALEAPDCILFAHAIVTLSDWYQKFLNSYDKKDRTGYLHQIYCSARDICRIVQAVDIETFPAACREAHRLMSKRAETNGEISCLLPQELTAYKKECINLIMQLHDFSLGLASQCTVTDPEPYKKIYNELEKIT